MKRHLPTVREPKAVDEPHEATEIRAQIRRLVGEYHRARWPELSFDPEQTPVPVSGRVFDATELCYLVDSSLDFWLTTGRFAEAFEKSFAEWLGVRKALLVNSGSSANLVALSCLTSERLADRRLKPGDEVITAATGFPTTVNPIIQNGLVPVFLDTHLPTYNMDSRHLEEAIGPRTRAIMIAHALGNPFDLDRIMQVARQHKLWVVEDTCDALGSTYGGQKVGTFGHLATVSFYPAHHITMGEGGAVVTNDPLLQTLAESFRDWGRDCWCDPGKDNTCGKRFEHELGGLPAGYDHKYIYSHVGYNLKLTDMQAAVGLAQLQKLDSFVEQRRSNFEILRRLLEPTSDDLLLPEATEGSSPSWFGFPISIREGRGLNRRDVVRHIEERRVATRLLFGGNLLRQPAYRDIPHRSVGGTVNADYVMRNTFWIGVYPGLTRDHLEYAAGAIQDALVKTRQG
jgi:CDP-6-deoxy-D-xylo-4-hexulose-3-dehydrase